MRLSKCFSVSFTYIGAVIGAGFATGREVMLYFGDSGIVCAAAGGALMGLLAGIFLFSSRTFSILLNSTSKAAKGVCIAIKICLYIATYATFLCMLSACEEIISQSFGIKNVGVWTGLFVSFVALLDMRVMQKFNLALVPVIIVLLLVLAKDCATPQAGKFSLFKVLSYACMNVMTGGYLLAEQREKFTVRECVFTSVFTAAVFASAVAIVFAVSAKFSNFSMPVYEFAKINNLKGVSGAVIYLAVFTTLIGCAKLVCQENDALKIPKACSVVMLIITTFIGVRLNFARAVAVVYPAIGYAGIAYLIFMSVLPIAYKIFLRVKRVREIKAASASDRAIEFNLPDDGILARLPSKEQSLQGKEQSLQGKAPKTKKSLAKFSRD